MRPLMHILLIAVCFLVIVKIRPYTDLIPWVQLRIPPVDLIETLVFVGISVVVFLVAGFRYGLYELWRPIHSYYKNFLQTRILWAGLSSLIAYMGFGYLFTNGISRVVLIWGIFLSRLVLTIADIVLNTRNAAYEKKNPYRLVVIDHDAEVTKSVVNDLGLYQIYQVYYQHPSSLELGDAELIIVCWEVSMDQLQEYADRARILGAQFYHASSHLFLEDLVAVPQRLGPVMAMEYRSSPLDGRWRVIKRVIDVMVSWVGLVVLSPVFALIGILIKLDSPWPVFYKQPRIGKNGKLFTFVKFRSMYTHLSVGDAYWGEDAEKVYKEMIDSEANVRGEILSKFDDDPRVTRIWKFLRKTSLDEFPSLVSVLRGTMSLVWPRPHMEHEVAKYQSWQKRLLSIKPWMTGYAQLFGRDQLLFEEEAKLDLYYIQHRSMILDRYVLVSTVKVVLRGR